MNVGARGRFEVLVDGVLVAEKDRRIVARLLSGTGGWPDETAVVEAIKRRAEAARV